jgi:hypothetical protein
VEDTVEGRRASCRFGGNDDGGQAAPPAWVAEFLATLIVTGSMRQAVAAAGIQLEAAWDLREREAEFAMYWDKAVRLHRSGAMEALVLGEQGVALQ